MTPIALIRPRLWVGCAVAVLFLVACGGTDPSPGTGTLQVTVTSTGTNLDSDGYTLLLQGSTHGSLPGTGQATVTDLVPGAVTVGLGGLAGNCTVAGENPRSATITTGEVTEVAFAVNCSAPAPQTGTIQITTTTSGSDLPDGYTYSLDGGASLPISANTSIQISDVAVGSHIVTLAGLTINCTMTGSASRLIAVTAGGILPLSFAVNCDARVGTIEVTATTGGRGADPDGYIVQVDDGLPHNLPANGILTLDVPPGIHIVSVTGEAANCTLVLPTTHNISVNYHRTTSISVEAVCPGTLAGRILFVAGIHLASMAPDGTGREQVTTMLSGFEQPTVSPDGHAIAYAGWDIASVRRIYRLNYYGKGKLQLSPPSICAMEPAWSPDGSSIAFLDCSQTIWVMDADGSNAHQVTPSGITGDYSPSWSPDGTKLAHGRDVDPGLGGDEILGIMNTDGSGRVSFDLGVGVTAPQWSPDGSRILFTGGAVALGTGDIYTVHPDGTALTRLTTTGIAYRGRWSPDGQRITYTQSGAAAGGVYTMQADGSMQTRVSPPENNDFDPTWVQ